MDSSDILKVYMAQSENVRHLNQVLDSIKKDINLEITLSKPDIISNLI